MSPNLNTQSCANPACAARLTPESGALCRYCCDRLPAPDRTMLASLSPQDPAYPRAVARALDHLRRET